MENGSACDWRFCAFAGAFGMRWWTVPEVRSLGGGCALQVAAQLGRSPRAVQDKARSIGAEAPRMPHACYWPEATKSRALAMRSEGRSLASISRATGVPFGTLRHWVYGERNGGGMRNEG